MSNNTQSLTRPLAVRGATVTATATLSTGTIATLLAGDTDYRLDLTEVSFANSSDKAISIVLSDDGTTVKTVNVPLSGSVQLHFDVPYPQNAKNGRWAVDMGDFTNTSVVVDATFIKQ